VWGYKLEECGRDMDIKNKGYVGCGRGVGIKNRWMWEYKLEECGNVKGYGKRKYNESKWK